MCCGLVEQSRTVGVRGSNPGHFTKFFGKTLISGADSGGGPTGPGPLPKRRKKEGEKRRRRRKRERREGKKRRKRRRRGQFYKGGGEQERKIGPKLRQ